MSFFMVIRSAPGALAWAKRTEPIGVDLRNWIATNTVRMSLFEYCNQRNQRGTERHNDSEGKHGELP